MLISVIIPTLNEAANIGRLLSRLTSYGQGVEILVVDGGSSDATVDIASKYGVTVLESEAPGRAVQMNYGVRKSRGEILYFVHGDTLPPTTYANDIRLAIEEGNDMGCYRFKFETSSILLKINAYFTRFNKDWCRGGDQSLFIRRSVFLQLGGYEEKYVIMEDFELLRRAGSRFRFQVMPAEILVSARKYQGNNYLQVQLANLVVFNMFKFGYEPQRILETYRRLINYRS